MNSYLVNSKLIKTSMSMAQDALGVVALCDWMIASSKASIMIAFPKAGAV